MTKETNAVRKFLKAIVEDSEILKLLNKSPEEVARRLNLQKDEVAALRSADLVVVARAGSGREEMWRTAITVTIVDPGPIKSDIRLKTDIQQVGTSAHKLPLYTFRYIGKDDTYEGVMAQDVLRVLPSAVSVGEDGYYRVNYDMLGIELRRLD
jgi:hypothetical protein